MGCDAGEICLDSGHCIEEACRGVSCDPGTICRGGTCVDACDGVICPEQQTCEAGECADVPPEPEMPPMADAGVGMTTDPATPDCETSLDCFPRHERSGGCAVGANESPSLVAVLLGLLGVLVLSRRRRR